MKLFVDDIRSCPDGWQLARTITEAIRILSMHKVEIVSLDHDIACRLVTGHEHSSNETFEPVARFIAAMPDRPIVWIHSGNFGAGKKMAEILGITFSPIDINNENVRLL